MANDNKTIIITGANSGIGFDATVKLAEAGYSIILACRSQQNAEEAITKIKKGNEKANLTFMQLDLSDLSSVRKFVKEFQTTGRDLYALINNAGITYAFGEKERKLSKDGFEMTMSSNYIGHFLLTTLLLDDLKKGGETFGHAKIINTTSSLHDEKVSSQTTKRIDKNLVIKDIDLEDLMMEKEGAYCGIQAYKNSKAAQVMFTFSLSRLLEGTKVTANAVCPGFIPGTGLGRHNSSGMQFFMKYVVGGIFRVFKKDVIKTVDDGGKALTCLILLDKWQESRVPFFQHLEPSEPSAETQDESKQQALWELTEKLIVET